jgi:hypothetical protein
LWDVSFAFRWDLVRGEELWDVVLLFGGSPLLQ